jgi:hypothetical protein
MATLAAAVELPPGPGLVTTTWAELAAEVSVAETKTCRVVALTKVVARADPFQRTDEFASNPVPVTSRVAVEDCSKLPGEMVEICGVGALTAKLAALDVPPPVELVATVIDAVSPFASNDAGTVACNDVELT